MSSYTAMSRGTGYGRSDFAARPPNPWRVKVNIRAAGIPLVNGAPNVEPGDRAEVTLIGAPPAADGKPATLTVGVEGAGKTWREGTGDYCYLYLREQPGATATAQRYGLAFARYLPDTEGRAARAVVAEAEKAAAAAVAAATLELARALETKLDAEEAELRARESEQRIADEKRAAEAQEARAAAMLARENSPAAQERKAIVAHIRTMAADHFRALAGTMEFRPRSQGTSGPGPQGEKLLDVGEPHTHDSLRVFLDGEHYTYRPLLLTALINAPDGTPLIATKILQKGIEQ